MAYDLLIKNGRVIDGSGMPAFHGDVAVSNGTGWSPDGSLMYYIDSPTRRVDVFDHADGAVTGRRPFVEIEDGVEGLVLISEAPQRS